jgi:hypothetical protein
MAGKPRKKGKKRTKKRAGRRPAAKARTRTRTVTKTRWRTRKAPTAKRRRRSTRRRTSVPKLATGLAIGTVGGIGSSLAVNAMPIADPRAKAALVAGTGLVATTIGVRMAPRNMRNAVRLAGVGAMFAGAFGLTRAMFPQVPLIAGERNRIRIRPRTAPINRYPRRMGINAEFGSMGKNLEFMGATNNNPVYGSEFLTPANMI